MSAIWGSMTFKGDVIVICWNVKPSCIDATLALSDCVHGIPATVFITSIRKMLYDFPTVYQFITCPLFLFLILVCFGFRSNVHVNPCYKYVSGHTYDSNIVLLHFYEHNVKLPLRPGWGATVYYQWICFVDRKSWFSKKFSWHFTELGYLKLGKCIVLYTKTDRCVGWE